MVVAACSIPESSPRKKVFACIADKGKPMRKPVKTNKTNVHDCKDASGGSSPYWEYTARSAREEEDTEDPRANPDMVAEGTGFFGSGEMTQPQFIFGEAVEHLQGRQKEAWMLVMREQLTEQEAAEVMGVRQQVVATYLKRATKFITRWCEIAMARGRV